jgi:transposase
MPPAYVKPYVKRQKNDSTDAEAICEAVTCPNMRFVPTLTPAQQGCLMLHRARHLFIRQGSRRGKEKIKSPGATSRIDS